MHNGFAEPFSAGMTGGFAPSHCSGMTGGFAAPCDPGWHGGPGIRGGVNTVSYTHLTLPTTNEV